MTAFDELLNELASLPGKRTVGREELERALVSVALHDCQPGFITRHGDDGATFTLEGVLAFLLVCRKDAEATPRMRQLGDLVDRATDELGKRTE